MEIRYYNDPDTGMPHIYGHGVTEKEIREVLLRPGQDTAGDEDSRIKVGQTAAGRYLKVIYSPDIDRKGLCVITAFELRGKAKRAYRRRRRGKQR